MFLRTLKLKPRLLIVGTMLAVSMIANAGITLTTGSDTKVSDVISSIKRQSDYIFFYNDDIANVRVKAVTINNEEIKEALKKIFEGTSISYIVKDNVIYLKKARPRDINNGKKRTVTGTVVDETGEPIIGGTVLIKGSSNGVATDFEGNFTLDNVPEDADIVFSYIGYKTQSIKASDTAALASVVMAENTQILDEVVVVGYGTQRRHSVTGSVAQVSADELKKAPAGNLSSLLQGKLPGLVATQNSGQPGSDGVSMYVRGVGNGDGSVLCVVDGIVRPFPNVSPEEIESITVLKDAASAAVYGFNGSGGVILITTKHGDIQKPTITVNSAISLSTNTAFPKFLNGPDYMKWYDKAQELDGYSLESRRFTQDEINRATYGDPLGVYTNNDWFDLLFKDAATTYNNNISLSGGTERYKYFVSFGAYNQDGVIENTSYDNYSVRSNIDARITSNFDVSVGINLRQSNQKEPSMGIATIMQQAMLSYPYLPAETYSGMPVGSLNGAGNGNNNPLAVRDLSGLKKLDEKRIECNIQISYKIPKIKGLTMKFVASYDYLDRKTKFEKTPYKLAVYNQSTRTWTESYGRVLNDGKVRVQQDRVDQSDYYIRPSIEYDGLIGQHNIQLLALYEYGEINYTDMSAGKWDYPIDDILDLTWGNEVIPNSVYGTHNKSKRAGFVGRINYSYDNRYLAEVSARVDGTQMLPGNNRWGVFPGVSVGWRITEEDFIRENPDLHFLNNLKLRLSFGRLGSQNGLGYGLSYLSMASLSQSPIVAIGSETRRYLNIGSIPNGNLKWQYTDTYNIGLDASLWNGLLGMEADLFYSRTRRKIEAQAGSFPPSLGGYFSPLVNSGEHDNRGFELLLTHMNRIGNVNYSVRGNLSWSRNKVLKINESSNVPMAMRQIGKPMGQYYGFVSDGLFQSEEEIANSAVYGPTLPGDIKLVDINRDGKITFEQDRVAIGRSNIPEMTFGLNLTADWKGFDFNAFFQGAAIFDVYLCGTYPQYGWVDDTFYTRPFFCDGNVPYYLVEGAWTPDHTDAEYPRLSTETRINGGKYSDWWVKNGAYMRLKNAQIGYTLPTGITTVLGLQKVRAYVAGRNLFTISGVKYFDPEMPNVNQGYYPQQRVYEFGLNISF